MKNKFGFLKKLKKDNPSLIIGIVGCMAENRKEELLQELPHLDFVVGCGQLHRVAEALEESLKGKRPVFGCIFLPSPVNPAIIK